MRLRSSSRPALASTAPSVFAVTPAATRRTSVSTVPAPSPESVSVCDQDVLAAHLFRARLAGVLHAVRTEQLAGRHDVLDLVFAEQRSDAALEFFRDRAASADDLAEIEPDVVDGHAALDAFGAELA